MHLCLTASYLVKVKVAVYTKRDEVGQALGCKVLFGDAQLLVTEGALIDSYSEEWGKLFSKQRDHLA